MRRERRRGWGDNESYSGGEEYCTSLLRVQTFIIDFFAEFLCPGSDSCAVGAASLYRRFEALFCLLPSGAIAQLDMAPSPLKAAISSLFSKSLTRSVRSSDAETARRPSEAYEFVFGRPTLAGRIGLKATKVEESPSKFEISGLKKGVVCVFGLSSLTNSRYLPVPRLIPSMLARFTITSPTS
jgi:hypothetical protein